ncbi:MAG: N-acetylmuramoyl-L-alanine amidase [Bacteroidales bacterium]|nr:N-acetylmuramoyl-L-alanine amidase [Candidatus Scybalousia scybalohippi]
MLPETQWRQFGYPRPNGEADIEGIVIHNTGSLLTASELFNWLKDECKTSQGTTYIVDKDEIIQVVPDTFAVYSCGKGDDYSTKHLIAIEICDNINNEDYLLGQDRAIELIKSLMEKYNIPRSQIFFHLDFDNKTRCPHTILDLYGTKKNFLDNFIN